MAEEAEKLTGIYKYLNSSTNKGRANTAKLTYAVLGVVILYNLVKPKKNKPESPA